MENKVPEFFSKNKDLKIIILKMQFFHMIMIDCDKGEIINFYNEYMQQLIHEFKNPESNQTYLQNIMTNPEIVKSRYYQQKWEEISKIFVTACEKALINVFYQHAGIYFDPRHTCMDMCTKGEYHQCMQCVDDLLFVSNVEKLFTYEEDLWGSYFSYQNYIQSHSQMYNNSTGITSSAVNNNNIIAFNNGISFDSYMASLTNNYNNVHNSNNNAAVYNNNHCNYTCKNQPQGGYSYLNNYLISDNSFNDLNLENYYLNFNGTTDDKNMQMLDNINININVKCPSEGGMTNSNDGNTNINVDLDLDFDMHMEDSYVLNIHEVSSKISSNNNLTGNLKSNISYTTSPKFIVNKQSPAIKNEATLNYTTSSIIKSSISNTISPKNESKQKIKIPFLKEFNIKFTKRENIDKKILRKFRKFLKDKLKKGTLNLDTFLTNIDQHNKNFWTTFINDNLLPPMKFKENNEIVEFKSFNTTYMVWLLSHKGSVELYEIYIKENFNDVLNLFVSKFNLKENDELNQLRVYVANLASIFYSVNNENEAMSVSGAVSVAHTHHDYEVMSKLDLNGNQHNQYDNLYEGNMGMNHIYEEESNMKLMHATESGNSSNNINMFHVSAKTNSNTNYSYDIFNEIAHQTSNGSAKKNPMKDNLDNSFEKSEDLGKMFNNSFDYDNEYIFGDD